MRRASLACLLAGIALSSTSAGPAAASGLSDLLVDSPPPGFEEAQLAPEGSGPLDFEQAALELGGGEEAQRSLVALGFAGGHVKTWVQHDTGRVASARLLHLQHIDARAALEAAAHGGTTFDPGIPDAVGVTASEDLGGQPVHLQGVTIVRGKLLLTLTVIGPDETTTDAAVAFAHSQLDHLAAADLQPADPQPDDDRRRGAGELVADLAGALLGVVLLAVVVIAVVRQLRSRRPA